jgi:hypothetical protein
MKPCLSLLALFTCVGLLTGCESKTDSVVTAAPAAPAVPPPPRAAAEEGGVNGGGGGTLPANPISIYEVHEIIREAKKTLGPFVLHDLNVFQEDGATGYDQKLFGGRPNLYDILYSTNIEILDDAACKDSNGNDVDGSVHSKIADAICISAFRIAPKLIRERASIEILSLIYHELGHKLGLNEAEAVDAQKMTALKLSDEINHVDIEQSLEDVDSRSEDVSNAFWKIDFAQTDQRLVTDLLKAASASVNSLYNKLPPYPFAIFSNDEFELLTLFNNRLMTLTWALSKDVDATAKYEIDNIFLGQPSVTYAEFKARMKFPAGNGEFDGELLYAPKDLLDAKPILHQISLFYSALAQRPKSFLYGTKPNPLVMPLKNDRFAPFAGSFEVTAVSCDDPKADASETRFEVKPNSTDNNRLHLFSYTANSFGDDGGLYDGASGVHGNASISTDAGTDWASRSEEFGDRWGSRQGWGFQKRTIRFAVSNGAYSVTRTDEWRSEKYNPSGFDSSKATCVFQVKHTN